MISLIIIVLLILILYSLKGIGDSNYMLYPYYSWENVDHVNELMKTAGKLANKCEHQRIKLLKQLLKKANKKGGASLKFEDYSEEYLSLFKKRVTYETTRQILNELFFFMLRSNHYILNKKKAVEQIEKEYHAGLWQDILNKDGSDFDLWGKAKEKSYKKYAEIINQLKKP